MQRIAAAGVHWIFPADSMASDSMSGRRAMSAGGGGSFRSFASRNVCGITGRLRRRGLGVIKDASAGFAEINFLVFGAAQNLVNVRANTHTALHAHLVYGLSQSAMAVVGNAVVFREKHFRNVSDNGGAFGFRGGKL
jgi:hypothetical protein